MGIVVSGAGVRKHQTLWRDAENEEQSVEMVMMNVQSHTRFTTLPGATFAWQCCRTCLFPGLQVQLCLDIKK